MPTATTDLLPLITSEWRFDPSITYITYRTHHQKATTLAKARLTLLQKSGDIPAREFLKSLDDLMGFVKLNTEQAGLWMAFHPSIEMRAEAGKARSGFEGLQQRIVSSPAIGRILESLDPEAFDDMGRRFLECVRRDAKRAGAFLGKEERKVFRGVNERLEALEVAFRENVAGVKECACTANEEADSKTIDGIDSALAKVEISVDAEAERSYKATYSIAPQNERIIQQMTELRLKRAHLLGYANFIEYALEEDTLVDPKTIRNELAKASVRAVPGAEREMEALRDAIKANGKELKPWNVQEAKDLLLRQRFPDFDGAAMDKFFRYESVVSNLLQLINDLFSLDIHLVTGAKTWHTSVKVYEVFDVNSDECASPGGSSDTSRHLLGRIYLDLIDRPGKDREACTFPVFPSLPGSGLLPAVCIAGSYVLSEESSFDFSYLKSLFHELGHGMHFLLDQRSEYNRFNAFEGGAEFGEVPGLMLEELLEQERIVKRIAVNEAGEEISGKELKALLGEGVIDNSMLLREQILYSLICVSF
jgi:Zn-dependent oligopeptidase